MAAGCNSARTVRPEKPVEVEGDHADGTRLPRWHEGADGERFGALPGVDGLNGEPTEGTSRRRRGEVDG